MNYKPIVLIVEDDKTIRNFMRISLETQAYKVIETSDGQNAYTLFLSHQPDVILLDLGLPDMDGLELLSKIREISQVAVLVVSARGREEDKIEALDLGADDYLTKPFSVAELLARIRVALRHQVHLEQTEGTELQSYQVGDLKVDFDKRLVFLNNEEVHLTPIEFKLMALMAKNPGKVMTHKFMIKEVWGSYGESDAQSLRVFMANLRRKIEQNSSQPRYIMTEVGVGYRLMDGI